MLVELRIENHRSICAEQVLTFAASSGIAEGEKSALLSTPAKHDFLLPAIVIYGANASGKSNMLAGFEYMQKAVLLSHRLWEPDLGVPRQPFAWGEWRTKPSTFEAEFYIRDTKFRYGFVVDDNEVLEEWLYAFPKGHKQSWYSRDRSVFKFSDYLKGERKAIEDVTRPNSLFLSAAVQNRHEQLLPIYTWFRSAAISQTQMRERRYFHAPMTDIRNVNAWRLLRMANDEMEPQQQKLVSRFRRLLQESDFGVVDFRIQLDETDGRPHRRHDFYLLHREGDEDAWLPLEEESSGTRTMFRLAPLVLDALQRGSLLIVDELESSLHPLLAIELIRLFSSSDTNPHGSQILFTTHDSNILGNITGTSPLRRDQVYFTEKNEQGESVVYPLTDFKPRKSENIERGYLQGRYGAIPYLAQFHEVAQ